MSRYSFFSLVILLLANILFAAQPPSTNPWQLPAADVEQWSERLRQLVRSDWTVSNRGNDIIVQRNAPVRWRRVEVNQPAREQGAEEPPARLHDGVYRLTLRLGPKMSIEECERLAAANAQTVKQREELKKSVADIPRKFDSYLPRNDDERQRLATYREALARLKLIPLPDLYTPDHSIQLLCSYDGWWMLHDQEVAEECDGVRESILRYFGTYDPKAAANPHNLIHPEATSDENAQDRRAVDR